MGQQLRSSQTKFEKIQLNELIYIYARVVRVFWTNYIGVEGKFNTISSWFKQSFENCSTQALPVFSYPLLPRPSLQPLASEP